MAITSNVIKYASSKKILVFVGNGGVGKTTLAAAAGVLASQGGLRTAVITIDPSKRLTAALGLNSEKRKNTVSTCDKYSMDVFWVDPGYEFANFLKQIDSSSKLLKVFEKNKLYQQMVNKLGETQNFSSLFLMDQILKSKLYDLIILDTPPHQHALDFLKTSNNLKSLLENFPKNNSSGLMSKLLNVGKDSFFTILSVLTGDEFSTEMKDFLDAFPQVGDALLRLSENITKNFISTSCSLNLVTSADQPKIVELKNISLEVEKLKLHVDHIWINRSKPLWLDERLDEMAKPSPWLQQAMTFYEQNLKYVDGEIKKLFGNTRGIYLPEINQAQQGLGDIIGIAKKMDELF